MPVVVSQEGFRQDLMGLGVIEQTIPFGNYTPLKREQTIGSEPVPDPKGYKLGSSEHAINLDATEYTKDDQTDEKEQTYYNRAVNYLAESSNSMLDYNNDGIVDSKDFSDRVNDIAQKGYSAVNSAKESIEGKISDIGADSLQKSGAVEVIDNKTEQALDLVKQQSDLALLKVDEVKADVNAQVDKIGNNLMIGLGGVALAYFFLRGD